ncbi:MAG TPA: Gfo/Idh/MocA family oxidoreductase [Chthonomonadales bacterium]|nr:Gfo/Idh/MocA family oxidoreductase [Chthonomonadales bacterium]
MAKKPLNIALIGYQFMGKAHSNAYRQVARFFDLDVEPVMKVLVGRDEAKVRAASEKFGWHEYSTNWEDVVNRPDIDLVDIATTNNVHASMAIAAARCGKHVLCEKPLATNLSDAKAALAAAESAGIVHGICHNYRKAPAIALAKRIIDDGRLGHIYHFRGVYLQDYIVDPSFPVVWRLDKSVAGSGSHGDLNGHIIDAARWLVGDVTEVCGMLDTFIKKRPKLAEIDDRLGGKASDEMADVTVDDSAIFMARFANGAVGSFEATRFALGRKNHQRWEINGSKGSLAFNLERMNELEVYFKDEAPDVQGFRLVQATDGVHPYAGAYWPVAHIIGYEHTFVNLVKDLLEAIAAGKQATPNFADGVKNQAVLEAVDRSWETRSWQTVVE